MNDSIDRTDWEALADHFERFFRGIGDVTVDADHAVFAAPQVGTGLELNRDGTSRSFMPLHGLNLRWNTVTFDTTAMEVTLSAEGAEYTYRVPPNLLNARS